MDCSRFINSRLSILKYVRYRRKAFTFAVSSDEFLLTFSLRNMKFKNDLDSSMISILVDLNNFITMRVIAKFSDLTSCLA